MIDVRVGGKLRSLPESWDDLKSRPKDFKKVFRLFHKQLETNVFLLASGLNCLHVKPWHWQRVRNDAAQIIIEIMGFLLNSHPGGLSENPFLKLAGCSAALKPFDHLSTLEFSLVEKHFLAYAETQSHEELKLFVAAWYRPRRWFTKKNGDVRKDFNDATYRKNAAKFRKTAAWKMQLVWHYFLQIREDVATAHENLFQETKNAGKANWIDTIISLSAPGDEDKTAAVPIGIMLRRLELKAKEYNDFVAKNAKDEN